MLNTLALLSASAPSARSMRGVAVRYRRLTMEMRLSSTAVDIIRPSPVVV